MMNKLSNIILEIIILNNYKRDNKYCIKHIKYDN
jgi:hypothetical protein